jgi:cytochrome c oxidase cbb3-type subunit 3
MAGGQSVFGDNCAACHGSAAQGSPGYPNLADDDWLWGGTLDEIHTTIQHGIRAGDDDTRESDMPAFGHEDVLENAEIEQVVEYVMSLSGSGDAKAADQEIFADNCAACHGDDGKGLPEVGAPNLTDAIWLYGGSREAVTETVTASRHGVMPAWSGVLDDAQIKQLALYVHSLGGGE